MNRFRAHGDGAVPGNAEHGKRLRELHWLRRAIGNYDADRILGSTELNARECANADLARLLNLDYLSAAELLADALARRAANKLKVQP